MDAGPMINTCFRHQHPELYGGVEVPVPAVPATWQWGVGPLEAESPFIPLD